MSELLATDDRRNLEMLVRELRDRTLQDDDVARLIEASRKDTSEAHRLFAWRALLNADTASSRDHLAEVLLQPSHEAAAAEMLSQVDRAPGGAVPLLVRLYRESPSDVVRDAVLGVATGGARRLYAHDDANARLLDAILAQPASEAHRAEALLSSLERPGARSARTFQAAREALSSIEDPETRLRLLRHLAQASPAETLGYVLTSPMPEAEARVAIGEFVNRSAADPRLLTEWPAVIQAVRRVAESSPSSPLKDDAVAVRALMVQAAVKDAVIDLERTTSVILAGVARLSERPDDGSKRFVARWTIDTSPAFVESRLDALEATYGALPDRAAARARLEAALQPARDALKRASP